MRASSTLRGTLPGRKPGTRTCWASVRTTSPSARSNSGSSTSTLRRTRFPSIGSAVARITSGSLYRSPRGPGTRPAEPAPGSEHEVHGRQHGPTSRGVALQGDGARRHQRFTRGPTAAEAYEVDAREGEDHGG